MKAAIVGLGYVGLPLSLQFARSGVSVSSARSRSIDLRIAAGETITVQTAVVDRSDLASYLASYVPALKAGGQATVTGQSATLDLPPTARPTTRYWRVAAVDAITGHQGPFSAAQPLRQRAPAAIERATPVPAWRDSSGSPLRSRFGGQVQPGY